MIDPTNRHAGIMSRRIVGSQKPREPSIGFRPVTWCHAWTSYETPSSIDPSNAGDCSLAILPLCVM